jgi:uncharacterized protein YndB with AHSA1/START domain
MNKANSFNFIVDKYAATITFERSFNARLAQVWSAWTDPEILCQWWAPKPYECVIKSLDFREGGRWLYCMQGPKGDRHWCYFDYETIKPKSYFSGSDAFCDDNGVANDIKPKVKWEANFREAVDHTTVIVVMHFDSPADLDKIVAMGFKEGMTQGLGQLEELLKAL